MGGPLTGPRPDPGPGGRAKGDLKRGGKLFPTRGKAPGFAKPKPKPARMATPEAGQSFASVRKPRRKPVRKTTRMSGSGR